MDEYDVLIVGGGPAGSSCAWRLVQHGARVAVVDKATFPRDKVCAGWITPQVVDALQIDPDDYRQRRVWQPISGFRTGLIGGDEVAVRYEETISFGIRRCEFDTYLLRRSGASCHLGDAVRKIGRDHGRWVINDRFSAPILVGAGGHFCPVARHLGVKDKGGGPVVVAREVEFAAREEDLKAGTVAEDTPELFFCRDLQGYGWVFRKENYLNIGLGRLDARNLPKHVDDFCSFLQQRGKVVGQIPRRFHGHAYRIYYHQLPPLVDDDVLLVGDAAGLAYPQSGEGIRPAVESGLIAADVIAGALAQGNLDLLNDYAERIVQRFGSPGRSRLAAWVPSNWLPQIASRLLTMPWFARRVVMDQWFLHKQVPPLNLGPATPTRSAG